MCLRMWWDHTLSVYDARGLLQSVEYPNQAALKLCLWRRGAGTDRYAPGQCTSGRVPGGRILQITDEIGRRTQYRYEGDLLVDVVHTDEGITHYEYDENGHISSVTDQNGSCYLENEYDVKGRSPVRTFQAVCTRPLLMMIFITGIPFITAKRARRRSTNTITVSEGTGNL